VRSGAQGKSPTRAPCGNEGFLGKSSAARAAGVGEAQGNGRRLRGAILAVQGARRHQVPAGRGGDEPDRLSAAASIAPVVCSIELCHRAPLPFVVLPLEASGERDGFKAATAAGSGASGTGRNSRHMAILMMRAHSVTRDFSSHGHPDYRLRAAGFVAVHYLGLRPRGVPALPTPPIIIILFFFFQVAASMFAHVRSLLRRAIGRSVVVEVSMGDPARGRPLVRRTRLRCERPRVISIFA